MEEPIFIHMGGRHGARRTVFGSIETHCSFAERTPGISGTGKYCRRTRNATRCLSNTKKYSGSFLACPSSSSEVSIRTLVPQSPQSGTKSLTSIRPMPRTNSISLRFDGLMSLKCSAGSQLPEPPTCMQSEISCSSLVSAKTTSPSAVRFQIAVVHGTIGDVAQAACDVRTVATNRITENAPRKMTS